MVLAAAKDRSWGYFEKIGFVQRYGKVPLELVMKVAASPELSPLASGAGRVFDSVSALLGVCGRNTFEGEAAMALEALVRQGTEDVYAVELNPQKNGYTVVDFGPAILALLEDISRSVPPDIIAARFHNTVEWVISTMVLQLRDRHGIVDVALSGGTFQNLYLLNRTARRLSSEGMQVYVNQKVPCNDGGISLGQAYLIRERLKKTGLKNL
jgi:hydrogenase maturation protein HypF